MVRKIWICPVTIILSLSVFLMAQGTKDNTPKEEIPTELKARIEQLIKDLGAEDWQVREAATKALEEIGEPAEPFLKEALQNPDAEVKLRAKRLLRSIMAKKLGKIVFVRDGNIWVMDFDGQNQKQLTHSRRNYHPRWFPDGSRIAFVSHQDNIVNVSEIYSIDSSGENEKRLLKCAGYRISFIFSPDGKKILFIAHQDEKPQVYVVDSDGGNLKSLTEHLGNYNSDAVWSPDSKQIAFLSHQSGDEYIYIVDADGQNLERLTNLQGTTRHPFWSPDGREIVFTAYHEGGWNIFSIDKDSKHLKQLAKFSDEPDSPIWSPTGKQIAFEYFDRTPDSGIYVINANGKDLKPIIRNGRYSNSQWSPDGSKIAFLSWRSKRSNDSGLYVIDLTTGAKTKFLEESYRDGFSFAWSPNGEWIIFEILHGPHAEPECTEECGCDKVGIYVINVEDKRLIRLTDESGKGCVDAATPAWQPFAPAQDKPVPKGK